MAKAERLGAPLALPSRDALRMLSDPGRHEQPGSPTIAATTSITA